MFRFLSTLHSLVLLFALCLPAQASAGKYLLTLVDAQIAKHKANRMRWDTGWGKSTLPDVYVIIEIGGKRYQSTIMKDTLNPSWNLTWELELKGDERLYIKVMDKDFGNDDLIGERDLLLKDLDNKKPLTFGQVESLQLRIERRDPPAEPVKPASQPTSKEAPTSRPSGS